MEWICLSSPVHIDCEQQFSKTDKLAVILVLHEHIVDEFVLTMCHCQNGGTVQNPGLDSVYAGKSARQNEHVWFAICAERVESYL